jgi:hypothetical protein
MQATVVLVLGFLLVVETSGLGRWVRRRSRSDDVPWRYRSLNNDPWRSNLQAAPPLRKETADLLYGLTQPGTVKVRRENIIGLENNEFTSTGIDGPSSVDETGLTTTFINKASDQEVARCK